MDGWLIGTLRSPICLELLILYLIVKQVVELFLRGVETSGLYLISESFQSNLLIIVIQSVFRDYIFLYLPFSKLPSEIPCK